jgi:hypothetical protein
MTHSTRISDWIEPLPPDSDDTDSLRQHLASSLEAHLTDFLSCDQKKGSPNHFVKKGCHCIEENNIMVVCHSPFSAQANQERKGVKIVKIRRKATMNEHARRQEAKFWVIMRAAEPGKRCLK